MSDSVYDKDARIISDAIAVFTGAGRSIYGWSREEIIVDVTRREVYSYGRHFPLFRFVPRALNGARDLFLINGDAHGMGGTGGWHSSRTDAHQASARELIRATGRASCVIPFSALNGASIDLDSVRIVDVRPDEEWNETVTVRSLGEMPRWERTVSYTREHESARLEDLPDGTREEWRNGGYAARLPDPDGLYRYSRRVHRLGDSLFSATRNGRRARYLSSFDTNEAPPLYFLAQVPRGAGDTVAMAVDSLAPRAVHAAIARGTEVRRQGDIFFVDTLLSRAQLAARGAVFARLTQWDRDARARKGEVNYRAAQTAAERRREARYARAVWRERYADTIARAGAAADRTGAREETRAKWRELEARHERERREARAVGAPLDSPLSGPCESCGAVVGAACSRVDTGSESLNERIEFERIADGGFHLRRRSSLEARQKTELSNLRYECRAVGGRYNGAPVSAKGARRRARRDYLAAAANVDAKTVSLARVLAAPYRSRARRKRYGWEPGPVLEARQDYASKVLAARRELNYARERLASATGARARARDAYRYSLGSGGTVALVLWREARQTAAAKYRPDDFAPDRISARRERARRALAVYGTAHSATEVARVAGGAVYVRGVVRHVPGLEQGRFGAPDHAPLTLTPEHWYLAIRNTVPRQDTRGARRG